jgi:site-specific DNA recombinase
MRTNKKTAKEQPAAGIKYAALYIRVSTTDQGERYSLPSQLSALRAKAAREGYSVREDHVFTDQFSGKVASRPAFDRMNALVAAGAVAAVFIFSVDRFARRTEDALRLAREYKRHGVRLDFVEAPFEDTPTGRFTFTQLAAFAELWGEKIAADSARGRKQKLEDGKLINGSAKFGYVYIDKRQKNGARLEIDPVKAQVVRDVFGWRLEGMSMCGIAKRLNAAGILSAGYNGKPGGLWSKTTVTQMLRSRTYTGQLICSGITVPCPRIVADETFNAVQRLCDETRRRLVGRPSNKYLLRGLLWCRKCGRRCTTFPNRGYPNYRCNAIEHKTYRRLCFAPQIRQTTIEASAWTAVWSLLKNPVLLLKLGQAYYDGLAKPESNGAEKLEREAARLGQRIKTTRQMMRDSAIAYAEGLNAIRQDETRIRQIEEELSTAGRVVSLPPLRAAQTALREITQGPEPETYDERRPILEGILDLRMNYYNGDLEITGRVPMPDAASSGSRKNGYSNLKRYAACYLFRPGPCPRGGSSFRRYDSGARNRHDFCDCERSGARAQRPDLQFG